MTLPGTRSAARRRARERRAGAQGRPARTGLVAAQRQGHRRRVPDRAGDRRVRDRVQRRRRHRVAQLLRQLPLGLLHPVGRRRLVVLQRAREGLGRVEQRDRLDAQPLGAADLRGPGRDARVPRGPVQHRCPGAADHRRALRRLRRVHLEPAAVRPPDRGAGRRSRRWRRLGRADRVPQGPHRRPRGDHHDHVQLPRCLGPDLRAQPRHLPATRQRQRALAAGRRLGDVPAVSLGTASTSTPA